MSWAIWITGPPASGKSTLARGVAEQLTREGGTVCVLELDAMRRVVTPTPSYSDTERDLVYRALVWLAATLVDAGVPVIVDATAHRREWRDLARAVISHFAEVQLHCDIDTCRARDAARASGQATTGVYAHAGSVSGRVPGVDVEYEAAAAPELIIDTERMPHDAAVKRVCDLARVPPTAFDAVTGNGWAIWITGLPGSGKTTIASTTAEELGRYGVTVRVLELGDVLAFIGACRYTPLADLIAHRTLVYAAKVLTEAGRGVIVDATAPARAWRELARELIPRFAEVQLICPAEVCATRERAVRWRLMGCTHTQPCRHDSAPDIVLRYEPSLRPDVTIRTDTGDPESAAAAVVRLARRLHRIPSGQRWTRALAG
jgi:adenylylsulfate kinase